MISEDSLTLEAFIERLKDVFDGVGVKVGLIFCVKLKSLLG